jgi:hypothetical protein
MQMPIPTYSKQGNPPPANPIKESHKNWPIEKHMKKYLENILGRQHMRILGKFGNG